MAALQAFLVACAALSVAATLAHAEDTVMLHSRASPNSARLATAVGTLQMEINCPTGSDGTLEGVARRALTGRSVDITLSVPNPDYQPYITPILNSGVLAAFKNCPLPASVSAADPEARGGVGNATIYALTPTGESVEIVRARNYLGGAWEAIDDVGATRESDAPAQAPEPETQPAPVAQPTADVDATPAVGDPPPDLRVAAADPSTHDAQWAAWRQLLHMLKYLAMACATFVVLAWIWARRETLLRVWYELTPHPAERVVGDAVAAGGDVDIEALKESLKSKPANAAERRVRDAQLRRATARLRAHEAQLRADAARNLAEAERAAEEFAQRAREFDLGEAERELLTATLNHQTAAARAAALQKTKSGHGQDTG